MLVFDGGVKRLASLLATLLFELRRKAHLDRVFGPVGEGSMDLFLRVAILFPYLKYRRILFRYLSNTLYPRPYRRGIDLGIYASVVRGYSLYGHLFITTHA